MEYLIGAVVAVAVCVFARLSGFDRDRAFYSTLLIVVAHYYILFAVMGTLSTGVLTTECVAAFVFAGMAVAGFKNNPWLVAGGLAGHGVFDFFHHQLIQNPGVPVWWPGFCLGFDVPAGVFLAVLLMRRSG